MPTFFPEPLHQDHLSPIPQAAPEKSSGSTLEGCLAASANGTQAPQLAQVPPKVPAQIESPGLSSPGSCSLSPGSLDPTDGDARTSRGHTSDTTNSHNSHRTLANRLSAERARTKRSQRLQAMERTIATLTEKVKFLDGEVSAMTTTNSELEHKCKEYSQHIDALTGDIAQEQQRKEVLLTKVEVLTALAESPQYPQQLILPPQPARAEAWLEARTPPRAQARPRQQLLQQMLQQQSPCQQQPNQQQRQAQVMLAPQQHWSLQQHALRQQGFCPQQSQQQHQDEQYIQDSPPQQESRRQQLWRQLLQQLPQQPRTLQQQTQQAMKQQEQQQVSQQEPIRPQTVMAPGTPAPALRSAPISSPDCAARETATNLLNERQGLLSTSQFKPSPSQSKPSPSPFSCQPLPAGKCVSPFAHYIPLVRTASGSAGTTPSRPVNAVSPMLQLPSSLPAPAGLESTGRASTALLSEDLAPMRMLAAPNPIGKLPRTDQGGLQSCDALQDCTERVKPVSLPNSGRLVARNILDPASWTACDGSLDRGRRDVEALLSPSSQHLVIADVMDQSPRLVLEPLSQAVPSQLITPSALDLRNLTARKSMQYSKPVAEPVSLSGPSHQEGLIPPQHGGWASRSFSQHGSLSAESMSLSLPMSIEPPGLSQHENILSCKSLPLGSLSTAQTSPGPMCLEGFNVLHRSGSMFCNPSLCGGLDSVPNLLPAPTRLEPLDHLRHHSSAPCEPRQHGSLDTALISSPVPRQNDLHALLNQPSIATGMSRHHSSQGAHPMSPRVPTGLIRSNSHHSSPSPVNLLKHGSTAMELDVLPVLTRGVESTPPDTGSLIACQPSQPHLDPFDHGSLTGCPPLQHGRLDVAPLSLGISHLQPEGRLVQSPRLDATALGILQRGFMAGIEDQVRSSFAAGCGLNTLQMEDYVHKLLAGL